MSRELNQYYFKIQNIEVFAGADGYPCEGGVVITGEDLADIETITFTHAGGPTVVNAPFALHTGTQINVLSPALAGKTVTSIKITDTDGNDTILGSLTIAVSPLIDVTSIETISPQRLLVHGTGLGSVNEVVLDMAVGPNITVTVFDFQNDTIITIKEDAMADGIVNSVTAGDACTGEDILAGQTLAISDYLDCDDLTFVIPVPTPDHLKINGADLSQVDKVVVNTTGGDFTLYDPAGPNAASNTPGTAVVTWTNVEIELDIGPAAAGEDVETVQLRAEDNVLMTGDNQTPDEYCAPVGLTFAAMTPTVSAVTSPACETIDIVGTNLLGVNRLFANGPSMSYWNPAGPDSGMNTITTTIVAWTDTHIQITDIGLIGTVTFLDLFGVADTPYFGAYDFVDVPIVAC